MAPVKCEPSPQVPWLRSSAAALPPPGLSTWIVAPFAGKTAELADICSLRRRKSVQSDFVMQAIKQHWPQELRYPLQGSASWRLGSFSLASASVRQDQGPNSSEPHDP